MQAISFRLSQLRSYLRRLILFHGTGSLVLTVCAVVVFTFVCDFLFNLPVQVRAVLLGLSVALLGYILYARLIVPMKRTMSDDDLALCIESANPEVNCRIISAVQLSRESARPDFPYSRSLVDRLVEDAEEVADTVDPTRAINPAVVHKHLLLAGVCVALLAGFSFVKGEEAGIWLNRFFLGSKKWPRNVHLDVKIEPGKRIVKGDPVTIRVTAVKGSPSDVTIRYKFASGDSDRVSMVVNPEKKTEFTYKFPQVLSRLTFDVKGGDDEVAGEVVEIDIPPRIEEIQIYRSYPEYTKKSATPQNRPESDGNIKDVRGTQITFVGRSNIPLQKGSLSMKSSSGEQKFSMDLIASDRVKKDFVIGENADYSVQITGKNTLDNQREPLRYKISVVPDRAPLVVLKRPGQNRQVLADTIVDLEAEVSDDFGIKELQLKHMVTRGEQAGEWKSVPVPFPQQNVRYGPEKTTAVYSLDLGSLKLAEGDIVTYFVQASDYNSVTGPGIGESNRYQFRVVARQTLEEQIERVLKEIMLDLEGILKDQRKNLSDSKDYRVPVAKEGLSDKLLKRLPYLEYLQDQITQRARSSTDRLDRIVEDIKQFHLSQSIAVDKLEAIAKTVRGVGYDKSARAHQNLTVLRGKGVQPLPSLDQSIQLQEQIVKELQDILQLLEVWQDLSFVIRKNRELIRTTEDVDRILQDLLKQKQK